MAGDWIKMRTDLSREVEVRGIAKMTGLDIHGVIGRLYAVWAYADGVSTDGRILYTDMADIDEMVKCDGFAQACASVGWLEIDGDCVSIPRFDVHNGESAKKRVQANRRVAKSREKHRSKGKNTKCNAESVTSSVTKSVTREEKRREEKKASSDDDADCAAAAASTGLRFKSEIEAMIGRTGFPAPDGRSLDEVRKAIGRIESGMYPDAIGVSDAIGYLEARLRWYWDEQAVRRKHAERRLEPPSLRKTLADDRWRVDPDAPHWQPQPDETPKHISPERARALDRLTRRNAS